jgi:C-terminal processing protease CtpA/Prc
MESRFVLQGISWGYSRSMMTVWVSRSIFSVVNREKDTNPDFGCLKADQEDSTDSLGISFKMVKGLVRVREVSANGIFANTEISPGDVCLMVDGVPATLLWHME